MPTYLDTHEMGNFTEEQLKQALNSPKDEFGVTHKDSNLVLSNAFSANVEEIWKKGLIGIRLRKSYD
jgi:hypothetical protein